MKDKAFDSLRLNQKLLENLSELGFAQMTPIQELSLPLILDGSDVIAQAKTGSGKTVAFGLGILDSIEVKQTRPQALILCPTRELSEQVAGEIRALARTTANIKVLTITGGRSEYQQIKSLSHGAHIITGTPGRVLKLLKKGVLVLRHLKKYVLDEADRMLDMGFIEDISRISSYLPRERQTLLFSATFPSDIEELSFSIQKNAVKVEVDTTHDKKQIFEDFVRLESHKDKISALFRILATYKPERFIVFCKTKRICDDVADELYEEYIDVSSMHGDFEQNERTRVLQMFSNKSLSGIVATDVAARGIDIKGLDLVINFDLPGDPEVYVHRIGRTGRAGETGRSVSFFVEQELENLEKISSYQNNDYEIKELSSYETEDYYDFKPSMKTLQISGGKRDKLRPGDIVGAIVGEASIDFKCIGDISITNIVSFVAIKSDLVEHVCSSLRKGKIKNKRFKVEIL
jgi:ATP-independent RNA helicase DbpA